MHTIIEYGEFTKKAKNIFGDEEIENIISFLSANPKAGKQLDNFGGIRKLQWKDNTEYHIYFHTGTKNLPLVIVAIFRKGEKIILNKIIEILIHSKTAYK